MKPHSVLTTLTAISLAGVSLIGLASASGAQAPEAPPQAAADFDMKRCVNMGNALEAPNGAPWGRLYSQADYQRIKQAGFDTVRIPVKWSDYTGPAPQYRIHPDFVTVVDANVDWALSAGLNVVLNIHHFDEIMDDPDSQTTRFRALWSQIAPHYSDKPTNVWFEVLNEPHTNLKGPTMRAMQRQAIEIIRKDNPTRIIMLGGEDWSGINSLGTNLATDDPNVMYTFHYYDPFNFTHQQATWLGDDMPKGTRGWGSKKDKAELARAVEIASAFREATGRPVFLGEFGANSPIDNDQRVKWAGAVKQAMEGADIPWCLWAYGNTFELYDEESGWDTDMLSALTAN